MKASNLPFIIILILILSFSFTLFSEEKEVKLFKIKFFIKGYYINNKDLRELNTANVYTTAYTDDKIYFAYYHIALLFNYKIKNFLMDVYAYRDDFLGSDLIETGEKEELNPLKFKYINIKYIKPNYEFIIGRFKYKTIELEDINDYTFCDVVDGILAKYKRKDFYILFIGDWYSNKTNIAEKRIDEVKHIPNSSDSISNFDGNTNIFRLGMKFFKVLSGYKLSGFVYYGYVGGVKGGIESSEGGALGNYIDKDYVILYGFWLAKRYKNVLAYISFAYASGVDKKAPYEEDLKISGAMGNIGTKFLLIKNLLAYINLGYFEGSKWSKDGSKKEYGFLSLKGTHIGGILINEIYGYYPSPYLSLDGFKEDTEIVRKTGSYFVNLSVKYKIYENNIIFSVWGIGDTNKIIDSSGNINAYIEKYGKFVGIEIDCIYIYKILASFYIKTGIGFFIPQDYYKYGFKYSYAPSGNATAFAFFISLHTII